MRGRLILPLALLGLFALGPAHCQAATLFVDDFNDRAAGQPPDSQKWQVLWREKPGQAVVVENLGSDATHAWCTLHGRDNLGLRSQPFGPQHEAWVTLGVRIDQPTPGDQPAVVSFVDDVGQFPCDLRFVTGQANAFDAVILARDHKGAVSRQVVARQLAYHQWTRWTFGVKLDPTNGLGRCWVYRDGRPVAENVFLVPFNKVADVRHLQVWGNCPAWSIADVRVDTTNPIDAAATRRPLAVGCARTQWHCDYTCQTEPDGAIGVKVGAIDYTIRSGFSLPGGGYGWLGPPGRVPVIGPCRSRCRRRAALPAAANTSYRHPAPSGSSPARSSCTSSISRSATR